jgi:hypothetical protein
MERVRQSRRRGEVSLSRNLMTGQEGRRRKRKEKYRSSTDEGRRAGCPPDSEQMGDLLTALSNSSSVEIFGFYSRKPSYQLPH